MSAAPALRPAAPPSASSAPLVPPAASEHVFDTGAWMRAWERTDAERRTAARYLRNHGPDDFPSVAPLYLVEDSPMWNSYETDAGVGPVWPGPIAVTPSLYSFYGANAEYAEAILAQGLEQAHAWRAAALVVGNLTPDATNTWRALKEPSVALVLDTTYRADVSEGMEGHLAAMNGHARREFRREWRRSTERGVTLNVMREAAMLPRLAELHALADATARRHGPPLYTLNTFAALSCVPGATLLLAERDGVALGGFLTFLHDETLYLWAGGWNYARRAELPTYSFLFYESIRFAVSHGCRCVEAGRGNFAFKEKLGFAPMDLWSLVYLLPGPEHDALRARLKHMGRRMRAFLEVHGRPL